MLDTDFGFNEVETPVEVPMQAPQNFDQSEFSQTFPEATQADQVSRIEQPPAWEDVSTSDEYSNFNEKEKVRFREHWIAHASAHAKENWAGDKAYDENEFHKSMNEFFPERKMTLGNSFKDLITAVPDLKHHFQKYAASLETYQDIAKKDTFKMKNYSRGSNYWHFNNWSKTEPENENEAQIQGQVQEYANKMKDWGEVLNDFRKEYLKNNPSPNKFSMKDISIDKLLQPKELEEYKNDLKRYDKWRNVWAANKTPGKDEMPKESTFQTLGLDFSTFEGEGDMQKEAREEAAGDKSFQEKAFRESKRAWYNPSRVANMLSESVPHMAGLVTTGAINPAVAYQLSYATSTANTYDAYEDLPEEERIKKAKLAGSLIALTEVAMVGKYLNMFKGKNRGVAEFLKSAAAEGGQEALQEFIQIGVKRDDESFVDILSDEKVQDRLIEAAGSGAILGGAMQGAGDLYSSARNGFGTNEDLSPQLYKKLVSSMANNPEVTNEILNKESMGLADYNKLFGEGDQTNRKERAKIFATMQAMHTRAEMQDSQDIMEQEDSEQELEETLPPLEELEAEVSQEEVADMEEEIQPDVIEETEVQEKETKVQDEHTTYAEKSENEPIRKVKTPDAEESVDTVQRVGELDDFVDSTAKEFDQDNQNRFGERSEQIQDMINKFTPEEFVKDSIWTDEGAPFADGKNQIISGNGRKIVLNEIKKLHPEKWAAYQKLVKEKADALGIDISGIENPFFHNAIVGSSVSFPDIVRRSNNDSKKKLSVSENAESDAKILKDIWSENIKADDNGNFVTANNRDFNNQFLGKLGQSSDLKTSKGEINKKVFNDRMRGAVLSSVIGTAEKNRPTLIDLMENADTLGVNSEVNGLVQSGMNILNVAEEFDIQNDIASAYKTLIDYKKQKSEGNVKSVADYLGQGTFDFIEGTSENADIIFQQLAKRGKSAKAVKDYFNRYVELAKQQDTTTEDMFGTPLPEKKQLLEKADESKQGELNLEPVAETKTSAKKPKPKAKAADGSVKKPAKKVKAKPVSSLYDQKDLDAAGRFHGTSYPMKELYDRDYSGSEWNIYGGGLYTTDSAKTGISYTKKGKGGGRHLFAIEDKKKNNILDLEKETPFVIDFFVGKDSAYSQDMDNDFLDDVHDEWKTSKDHSARNFLDLMRQYSSGHDLATYEVQEYFYDLQDFLLEKGYDGFEHMGGVLTNNSTKHNVIIYFDPKKSVTIKEIPKKKESKKVDKDTKLLPSNGAYQRATPIEMNKKFEGEVDVKASMADIEREAKKIIPVRVGKYRANALGIYKTLPKVIRLAIKQDVWVLSHELGHFLSDDMNIVPEIQAEYEAELVKLGEKTSGPDYSLEDKMEEGVAEFVREFLLDEETAYQKAPKFHAYFTETLAASPKNNGSIRKMQQLFKGLQSQTPTERMMSYTQWDAPKKTFSMYSFLKSWIDEDHILKMLDVEVGKDGDGLWDKKGLMYGSAAAADNAFYSGITSRDGTKFKGEDGKPVVLQKIIKNVLDADLEQEFDAYVKSHRIIELHNRGIFKSPRAETAQQAIKDLEKKHPKLEGFRQDLKAYTDTMLRWAVKDGVKTQEEAELIAKYNLFYVPLTQATEHQSFSYNNSGESSSSWDKRIKSGGGQTIPVMEAVTKNLIDLSRQVARRDFDLALLDVTKVKGAGKWIELIDKPPQVKDTHKLKDFMKQMNDQGWMVQKISDSDQDADELFDISQEEAVELQDVILNSYNIMGSYKNGDNIITVIDKDGKRKYLQLPEGARGIELKKSILNMKEQSWVGSAVTPISTKVTEVLRDSATLSANFIVKNFLIDIPTAALQAVTKPITNPKVFFSEKNPLFYTFRGMVHHLFNTESKQAYMASGGSQSQLMATDQLSMRKMMRAMKKKKPHQYVTDVVTHPVEAARAFIDLVASFSNVIESAGNIAAFIDERQIALDKNMSEAEAMSYAGIRARRLKVDYSRGGVIAKDISKLSAFFNAGIQGEMAVINAFKRDPIGFASNVATYLFLPAVALWAANHDDDEYVNEISQNDKDAYFHIPLDKELAKELGMETKFMRVPKPRGIYSGIVNYFDSMLYQMNDQDVDFAKKVKEDTVDYGTGKMQSMIPNIMKPVIETSINKNMYFNQEIYSGNDNIKGSKKYNAWTSTTSIELSKLMSSVGGPEVPPAYIDHWVNGYLSNWGRTGVGLIDSVIDPDNKKSRRSFIHDTAGVKVMFQQSAGSRSKIVQETYKEYDILTQANKELKAADSYSDKKDVREEYKDIFKRESIIKNNRKYLNKEMKKMKLIYENDNKSGEQKRDAIIDAYKRIFKKLSKK